MKRKRKTVIAGNLVKIVEYTPQYPKDNTYVRGAKKKATRAAQRALNFRTAQGRLEEKLAANFTEKDFFATFTFEDGVLPESRAAAKKIQQQYIRRLRTARARRDLPTPKWIFSIESKHEHGRYHLHAVIDSTGSKRDFEEIISLWPHGDVELHRLFAGRYRWDTWLDVARYMTKERAEFEKDKTPVGAQVYACSRNLCKPVVLTEWISPDSRPVIPPDSVILEREEKETEFCLYRYVKYQTTAPLRGFGLEQ